MFPTPLQGMCLTGLDENDIAFGQGHDFALKMMTYLAVLHPYQFKKVVPMQCPRARSG